VGVSDTLLVMFSLAASFVIGVMAGANAMYRPFNPKERAELRYWRIVEAGVILVVILVFAIIFVGMITHS
jgi:hypothetical protein